jgi:hypothetical protein
MAQFRYNYEFSICADITKQCHGNPSGICQEWGSDFESSASLGRFASVVGTSSGLLVTFDRGEPYNNMPRTVKLTLTCDPNEPKAAIDSLDNLRPSGDPTSNYEAKGRSKYACTAGAPVLFIVLMILIGIAVIYLVAGFVLNKVNGNEGFHPHQETLAGIPELVKNGALFIGEKTCCRNSF